MNSPRFILFLASGMLDGPNTSSEATTNLFLLSSFLSFSPAETLAIDTIEKRIAEIVTRAGLYILFIVPPLIILFLFQLIRMFLIDLIQEETRHSPASSRVSLIICLYLYLCPYPCPPRRGISS